MLTTLTVKQNSSETTGVDFIKYAVKDGYKLSPVVRRESSIITMSGKKILKRIFKHRIDLTLVDGVPESVLGPIIRAVAPASNNYSKIVYVTYTLLDDTASSHTRSNVQFHVEDFRYGVKTVVANETYFSGVTITLEEV